MRRTTLRIIGISIALISSTAFAVRGASDRPEDRQDHRSGLTATITMPDGTSRVAELEGTGCSASMCSRVFLKAKAASESITPTWLDSIAEIKDTTANDALFILKDGSARRLSYVTDFRVLYIANRLGGPLRGMEKLDLAAVKSVVFP